MKASQANAYARERDYVIPEDVNEVLYPCTRHRIILNARAKTGGLSMDKVISNISREAATK